MGMTATTWAELDAEHAAHEAAESANEAIGQFQHLVGAILMDESIDPDEKAARIMAVAAELPARMKRDMMGGRRSLLDRVLGRNKATDSDGLGADVYAVVPDPSTPSTWKLRIDDAAHISGAIQALSPAGFRGQRVELDDGERAEALRKIGAAIRRLPEEDRGNLPDRLAALKSIAEPARGSSIAIVRDSGGTPTRFAAWASNNFRDREGEIFPEAAIKAAVDRFNARSAPRGYGNVFHVAPARWAEVDHAAYADGFVLFEGRVTDAKAAERIDTWREVEPVGTSIEYRYWSSALDAEGVYSSFDFDGFAALPRRRAANPWSPDISIKGEGQMPFNTDVRAALVTIYDEDQVKAWESQASAKAEELTAAGVARKELKFEAPAPTITFLLEAKADSDAAPEGAVSDSSGAVAAATTPDADPPAWVKTIADQQAAILARLDQSDAAIKSVKDELASAAPAVGVFGRSVQAASLGDAALKELSAQEAVIEQYKATGKIPSADSVGVMADWGVAGKVAAHIAGSNGAASRPAGS